MLHVTLGRTTVAVELQLQHAPPSLFTNWYYHSPTCVHQSQMLQQMQIRDCIQCQCLR